MKKCTVCKKEKGYDMFYKNKKVKDGYNPHCKECHLEQTKAYRRTFDGVITEIFSNQKANSKKRGHLPPQFTKEELRQWCKDNKEFVTMYESWVKSGYNLDLRPTLDRKDDYDNYNFNNIQPMIYKENVSKLHNSRKNGLNTKSMKPVIQMSLDGLEIAEFYSPSDAARKTGSNASRISEVCRGKASTHNGYKWKYKNK